MVIVYHSPLQKIKEENIMEELNKDQVAALFEREAVLLGTENCVPAFRVAALFGKDAVKHAHSMNASKPGYYTNGYGIGDYTPDALTFRGFQAAASFFNVTKLRKDAEA